MAQDNAATGHVAIIGAGSIGAAWSIVFARAGHQVALFDIDAHRAIQALADVRSRVQDLTYYGLLNPYEHTDDILGRIIIAPKLSDATTDAGYVQECVAESLDIKKAVFAELDARCDAQAVLASSSSMIAASRFAAELPGQSRCLVVHPGNPPYLLPIAEVVPAPFTAPWATQRTIDLLSTAGMMPIHVQREVEGFVFNRLQGALLREAYCLVRDGVASPTDIDTVVREGLGRRWGVLGPFATSDLNTRGGIERHAAVMGPAYERMGAERGQHDPWTEDLVAAVATDLHRLQPLDRWEENVARRDRMMMALFAAQRAVRSE